MFILHAWNKHLINQTTYIMKNVIKLLSAMSFVAMLALGTSFAQTAKTAPVTRASLEQGVTPAAATATTANACCEGVEASRKRCCAISRAMSTQAGVQKPAGEVKVMQVSEAVSQDKARQPKSTATKQD